MSKGFGQILSQAKKMQERFQQLQEEMESRMVEGQSGGGMVTCVVNGKQDVCLPQDIRRDTGGTRQGDAGRPCGGRAQRGPRQVKRHLEGRTLEDNRRHAASLRHVDASCITRNPSSE